MDVSTIDERVRDIIRRFLQELPTTSDRKIAKVVDCDPKVVSQIRTQLLASGEIPGTEWRWHRRLDRR